VEHPIAQQLLHNGIFFQVGAVVWLGRCRVLSALLLAACGAQPRP
jgi:hypothetical protein